MDCTHAHTPLPQAMDDDKQECDAAILADVHWRAASSGVYVSKRVSESSERVIKRWRAASRGVYVSK